MKVVAVTDLCGGNSITLPERNLYKGLFVRGMDLSIVTHRPVPETEELENSGIKVIYIPVLKKFDLKAVKSLRNLFKQEKFDILYITYGKAITNCILAAWGLKIKIIGYIGSLNVHWHDPMAYLSFLNPKIDRMVCLSNAVRDHFVNQKGKYFKDRCKVIYKGYDPAWIKIDKPISKSSVGIPENAFVVCCIAQVRRIKGIPYLIKSADFLPEGLPVYFILIGKGMDTGKITRMAGKSKYSNNFRIFGYIDNIFAYTALCDIYIQPSITEGLGRAIIEAMCLKKPVIVTERGGAKDLVDEGENGFVVPVKSPRAIAEKIMWCLSNRDKLPYMGTMSLNKVKEMLNPTAMVEETYKLFYTVLKEQITIK